MNLSNVNNCILSLFCSVEEHDEAKRREFIEENAKYVKNLDI